jgi:3-oxoacyl-[acyl-carrier protein] reductase
MMRFTGKVVLVTGAAKGIGAAVARAFAAEDARNAMFDVDEAGTKSIVGELEALGAEVLGVRADVTRSADVRAATENVEARWGQIDILVNNAGGFGRVRPASEEIADEEWDAVLRLDLTSAFLCSKAVLRGMKRRRWGRIINMSSIGGRGGAVPLRSHYAAAKAGILGFTRHLSLEAAPLRSDGQRRAAGDDGHRALQGLAYPGRDRSADRAGAGRPRCRTGRDRGVRPLPRLRRRGLHDGRDARRQRRRPDGVLRLTTVSGTGDAGHD